MRAIMILLLIILLPSLAHSKMYKWEDNEGVLHFTDDFNKVPSKLRPDVATTETKTNTPSITQPGKSVSLSAKAMEPDDVFMAFHSALLHRKYTTAASYLSYELKISILEEYISSNKIKDINMAIMFMKSATMHSINIRHSNVTDERARVVISAKSEGEDYMAAIDFAIEDGAWKILNDNWHVDD